MYQICLLRQMSGHAILTVHRHFIAINLINFYAFSFIFANRFIKLRSENLFYLNKNQGYSSSNPLLIVKNVLDLHKYTTPELPAE